MKPQELAWRLGIDLFKEGDLWGWVPDEHCKTAQEIVGDVPYPRPMFDSIELAAKNALRVVVPKLGKIATDMVGP